MRIRALSVHGAAVTASGSIEFLSLGYNCEVAFQIRRRFGSEQSCFFDWGVFDIEAVLSLLESRFRGMLRPESLSWDSINQLPHDSGHGYSFHAPWGKEEALSDREFSKKLSDHCNKAVHLAQKFLNPEHPRIYFYKQQKHCSPERLLRLSEVLQDISPASILVLLRRPQQPATTARHPILLERVLKRFAPESDAKDADIASWDAVFDEFS